MNDFFNSIENSLFRTACELDSSIRNTFLEDTFIDDFLHDLKYYLVKSDVTYRLSKLPKDTLLEINDIDYERTIQCYFNHEEYAIPKEMIYSKDLEGLVHDQYMCLQLKDDGLYHIIKGIK